MPFGPSNTEQENANNRKARSQGVGGRGARDSGSEYSRTGDRELRDRLIFMFMPMVRYIVYRKVREVPAQCDVEDFLSCGLEALIRSIERYDPDKGATLEQYAWTRIHGAVLDELRRHDWAPRSLRRDERDDQQRPRELPRAARAPAQPRRARGRGRHDPDRADRAGSTRSRSPRSAR